MLKMKSGDFSGQFNSYRFPIIKNSKYNNILTESCRGWNCGNKVIPNGLIGSGRTVQT